MRIARLAALLVGIGAVALVVRHNVHLSEAKDWNPSLLALPVAMLAGTGLCLVAFPWMVVVAALSFMFGAPLAVISGLVTALLATAVQRVVGAGAAGDALDAAEPKTGRIADAIEHTRHHPFAGVTLLKLVAGQNGLLGYLLGAMRVPWHPLMWGSLVGLAPRAVLCAVVADSFI